MWWVFTVAFGVAASRPPEPNFAGSRSVARMQCRDVDALAARLEWRLFVTRVALDSTQEEVRVVTGVIVGARSPRSECAVDVIVDKRRE